MWMNGRRFVCDREDYVLSFFLFAKPVIGSDSEVSDGFEKVVSGKVSEQDEYWR